MKSTFLLETGTGPAAAAGSAGGPTTVGPMKDTHKKKKELDPGVQKVVTKIRIHYDNTL